MSNKKFGNKLSQGQMEMARAFEAARLTTISQAVKAFERGETSRINEWKRQLAEKQNS